MPERSSTAARHRSRTCDVAVVGAGISGLTAAHRLRQEGYEVVVLEARDRVGGRTLTGEIAGCPVDLGAAWVGHTQERVYSLADELGMTRKPTYDEGSHLLDVNGRLRRYSGAIPKMGILALLDAGQAQWRLGRLAGRVDVDAPWETRDAARLDAETTATRLGRMFFTSTARSLFEVAAETIWGTRHPGSFLHFLAYVAGAGGLEPLISTEEGAQRDRIVGGAQGLSVALAERLGESRVLLGSPVRAISQDGEGVRVTSGATVVHARRAVVSVPPNLASTIDFDPPLPADRDQLAQRLHQGSITKFYAAYDRAFWRDAGLSGQGLSDSSPLSVTFDCSPDGGSPGVMLVFAGGANARKLSRLSEAERRRVVLDHLSGLFGGEAHGPTDFLEHSWDDEEWTRGGPVCLFPPDTWTVYGAAVRRPCGRIHWVGTETATVWMGFMDGAVRSGERAATEIGELLGEPSPPPPGGASRAHPS